MIKFGTYQLPHVLTIHRSPTRLFVRKPIPKRSIPFEDDVGGRGYDLTITGRIDENIESTIEELRALQGTKDILDLGRPGFVLRSARLCDLVFPEDVSRPDRVDYEARFSLTEAWGFGTLFESVAPSDVLTGLPTLLSTLAENPVITEVLKHFKRGPNFGFGTLGSQSYPTLEEGETSYTATTPMDSTTVNVWFTKITVAAPCTVKQIHVYLGTVIGNKRVAIYDNASPANLLGQSNVFVGTGSSWNAVDLITPAHLPAAGTYWIGITEISGNQETYGYNVGASGDGYYGSPSYVSDPGFPSTCAITSLTPYTTKLANHTYAVKIKGYIKATKFTLSEQVTVDKIRFYSHVAAGNVRVAIYDNASPKVLMVESGSMAVAVGWNEVDVSDTALAAGTYWLVWQYDDVSDAPSYTAGSAGDGFYKDQAYGAFPATISGETSSAEKWTEDGTRAWTEIT